MKKCENCGRNIENEVKFCSTCGSDFESDRKQRRSSFDREDIQNNKLMAAFAYMGILVLIPIFAAKESKFARYHARQGLILLTVEIIFSACYWMLSLIVLSISWRLYFIIKIAGMASYVFLVLAVIGISNAVSGRVRKLPVIGNILNV